MSRITKSRYHVVPVVLPLRDGIIIDATALTIRLSSPREIPTVVLREVADIASCLGTRKMRLSHNVNPHCRTAAHLSSLFAIRSIVPVFSPSCFLLRLLRDILKRRAIWSATTCKFPPQIHALAKLQPALHIAALIRPLDHTN